MAFALPSLPLRQRARLFVPTNRSAFPLKNGRPRAVLRRSIRMTITPETAAPSAKEIPNTDTGVDLDRVVCKFGGSSLADADRLREVGKLVKLQMKRTRRPPVVVLSAMGPSTNELLEAGEHALEDGMVDIRAVRARAADACAALGLDYNMLCESLLLNLDQLLLGVKFLQELSPRTRDYLASFGERLSVRIFAAHLRQNENVPAVSLDSFDIGFLSDDQFTRAELLDSTYDRVRKYFDANHGPSDDRVAVVTGFIAKDAGGNITTLGRGGSDLTAAALGAAIGVSEVQVWKDVDGILSTDPRIVPGAVPLPAVSFDEAAEMAFFGAKVLHPIAMQPAIAYNVPVRVKNSYNPNHPGTVILQASEIAQATSTSGNPVTAISLKKRVQVVDVVSTRMLGAYGFLAEVFAAFAALRVSVDTIATSEVSISMTIDAERGDDSGVLEKALLERLGAIAKVDFSLQDKAIVSLVSAIGRGSEVVGRAVSALNKEGIQIIMISQGASKINTSLAIDGEHAKTAVRILHKEFFGC